MLKQPPHSDDRDVVRAGQNLEDVHAEGDDGEAGNIAQPPRQALRGGAAVQDHGLAGPDEAGRKRGDALLLLAMRHAALDERRFAHAWRHRAAIGAGEQVGAVEFVQVAADGGQR